MPEYMLYKGTRKLPETFTQDQINSIVDRIFQSKDYPGGDWGSFFRHRDATMILTTYLLALRPKECCCLKFSDINLSQCTARIDGRNNKRRKDRLVPVPKLLLRFLASYLKFPRDRFWRGSPYLFPTLMSNHISPTRFKHIFREKCLKPLGLWALPETGKVPKTRLYTLRHSRASHILKKQVEERGEPDVFAIANIMGHADIRSTMVYLHTDENYMEYLRDQVEV